MKDLLIKLKQRILYPPNFVYSRIMTPNKTVFQIREGEGAIIDDNGKKVAVYKDEAGKITTLSPVCTHLKCIIEWDESKKHWVCPCHQSEFSPKGKVLKGPAKKDLQKA
jgi:Rieske Fe-S protein